MCISLTLVLFSWRLPLYQVIMAGGLEPADSQTASYLLSATKGLTVLSIFAVKGRTIERKNFQFL